MYEEHPWWALDWVNTPEFILGYTVFVIVFIAFALVSASIWHDRRDR